MRGISRKGTDEYNDEYVEINKRCGGCLPTVARDTLSGQEAGQTNAKPQAEQRFRY
jgi:hypothetical protein